jgi:hypothetical protein
MPRVCVDGGGSQEDRHGLQDVQDLGFLVSPAGSGCGSSTMSMTNPALRSWLKIADSGRRYMRVVTGCPSQSHCSLISSVRW